MEKYSLNDPAVLWDGNNQAWGLRFQPFIYPGMSGGGVFEAETDQLIGTMYAVIQEGSVAVPLPPDIFMWMDEAMTALR